jgi:Predicted divalent heavy-metal cations transporter
VFLVHSVMDNIAENMALGISLVTGSAVNVVLIEAIFISNFPEGLASTHGMKANGRSKKSTSIAVIIGTISAVVSFAVLSKASPFAISVAISFAAGAILVMLAESMIPEAFEEGGSRIGLAATAVSVFDEDFYALTSGTPRLIYSRISHTCGFLALKCILDSRLLLQLY